MPSRSTPPPSLQRSSTTINTTNHQHYHLLQHINCNAQHYNQPINPKSPVPSQVQRQIVRDEHLGEMLPSVKTNIDATSQMYICLITHFPTFGSTESVINILILESTRTRYSLRGGYTSVSRQYNWSCLERTARSMRRLRSPMATTGAGFRSSMSQTTHLYKREKKVDFRRKFQ